MHKSSYSNKKTSTKGTKITLVIIWLLIIAVIGGGAYFVYGQVKQLDRHGGETGSSSGGFAPNVLFIIYDDDYSTVKPEFLLTRFDTVNNEITSVCLPETVTATVKSKSDTLEGQYKYGGPIQAVKAVEDLLSIKIDKYLECSSDTLEQFVDSFGGIEYSVEKDMLCNSSDGTQLCDLKKGKQTLGGGQAVEYFRYFKWDDEYQTANRRASLAGAFLNQYADEKSAEKITSAFTDIANYVSTDISIIDADSLQKNYSKLLVLKQPSKFIEVSGSNGKLDSSVTDKISDAFKD